MQFAVVLSVLSLTLMVGQGEAFERYMPVPKPGPFHIPRPYRGGDVLDREILYFKEPRTFDDALLICQHYGMTLVFPDHPEISSLLTKFDIPRWIGAMKDSDGHFTYLNGMWMKGKYSFENKAGDKNCVVINFGGVSGKYANTNCENKYGFVCQAYNLNSGHGEGGRYDLIVHANPRSFWEAQRECKLEGGDLLTNMAKEDNAWLAKFNFGPLFIGVTDTQKEGHYKFLNGKPVPGDWNFWFPKQPNNYFNQDCITTQGGEWDDTQCKYERGFVCQRRTYGG